VGLFTRLYDLALKWSQHKSAPRYLAGLSFAESSFFPIPPDVMLAPMSLAQPHRAWHFAFIASLFSVLGGVTGYLLGYFAMDLLEPWIHTLGYWERYQQIILWFNDWGIWIVFIAGFSPIPYKLFTITAGALSMALLPFILISIVARSARFYAVSGLMLWGGELMETKIRKYMDIIGWGVVALAVVVYLFYKLY
jgi:membrane protein YqaA with SNARE-associated domain